jgi:hypothetical protein
MLDMFNMMVLQEDQGAVTATVLSCADHLRSLIPEVL